MKPINPMTDGNDIVVGLLFQAKKTLVNQGMNGDSQEIT